MASLASTHVGAAKAHTTENDYNFDDIINHPRVKMETPLNKVKGEFFERKSSQCIETINENKKVNNWKKNLIADILDRFINNFDMAFEHNKIINVKKNENNVNLILITNALPIIIIGDLEYGIGNDDVCIIKRYDYMIDLNNILSFKITTLIDNHDLMSFKVGTDYLIIIEENLIKKLKGNVYNTRVSLPYYIDIVTKFEIWDYKFVNKFLSLLNQSNRINTGVMNGITKTFNNRRDESQVRKFIFTTNILNDFYRESYPHHDSPMNKLFKEDNTSIARYFKFHSNDAEFQTILMTKLFNKYSSVLKIYGIVLIEKINNVIDKFRTKFVKEIFDILKTSNYNVGGQSLNYNIVRTFLIQQFIENDGQVDLNSIKFLTPFFENMFGYYFKLAPENKIFEIDIKNEYEIPLIKELEKFTEFGNQKSEGKQDTYIDPISYDDISITDPNARILICNNTSYVFDCNYLIEVIESENPSNPITQIAFTDKEKHYIKFGNLDSYEEPAAVVPSLILLPEKPVQEAEPVEETVQQAAPVEEAVQEPEVEAG